MEDIPNGSEELYLSGVNKLIVYSIPFYYLCMCMTKSEIIHTYIEKHLLKGLYRGMSMGKTWGIDGNIVLLYADSFGLNNLYVNCEIWDELCTMFSLTEKQTNDLFKDWVVRKYGITNKVIVSRGFY